MAWGQNANITVASMNAFLGSRFATLKQVLEDLNDFNNQWYAPNGGSGLLALGYGSGDKDQIGSAITDAVEFYSVYYGNATIASGGAVTVSAGTGKNFDASIKFGSGMAIHA